MYRIVDGTETHINAAALIWASATACRDGDTPATLDEARPVIADILSRSPRSLLLIARSAADTPVAFAVLAPAPERATLAELHYLGAAPAAWGTGAARDLLAALPVALAKRGFTTARLSVYADNERAVRLYERLGWHSDGPPKAHLRTGKLELCYVLALC